MYKMFTSTRDKTEAVWNVHETWNVTKSKPIIQVCSSTLIGDLESYPSELLSHRSYARQMILDEVDSWRQATKQDHMDHAPYSTGGGIKATSVEAKGVRRKI